MSKLTKSFVLDSINNSTLDAAAKSRLRIKLANLRATQQTDLRAIVNLTKSNGIIAGKEITMIKEAISRVNDSHLRVSEKEMLIKRINERTNDARYVREVMEYCEKADAAFEAERIRNEQKRNAQAFNLKTDNWEAPAPDMTKNGMTAEEKRKAASDEVRAKLLARRQARAQAAINKKLAFGVGFHEVVVEDGNICSNDDFMWVKLRDIKSNLTHNITMYIGVEDSKIASDKLVKYMRDEDETIPTIDECGDELDWVQTMKETQHVIICHASISKFDNTKLYIMFNHFDKILDEADEQDNPKHPEAPEAEDVGYNDAIGSHEDKGYARRPVEDAVVC